MDNLPTRELLGTAHVDRLASVIHLLLGEVAVLSERVAALEGADAQAAQTRVQDLTSRVLAPLTDYRAG